MAKDDYHVIVYKILTYLYTQLKNGAKIDPNMIEHDGKLFKINFNYWQYIMKNMYKQGYIDGISFFPNEIDVMSICDIEKCEITPKGIEYISNDDMLNRVKEYMNGNKDIPTSIN